MSQLFKANTVDQLKTMTWLKEQGVTPDDISRVELFPTTAQSAHDSLQEKLEKARIKLDVSKREKTDHAPRRSQPGHER